MARSGKPRPIGSILSELIDRLGMGRKIEEARAREAWAEVAGPAIIGVTEAVWIKSGRMYIKITSPTWRHELHLQRAEWRDRVNAYAGSDVVQEIIFR